MPLSNPSLRRIAAAPLLLAALSCGETFQPATRIAGLRVLSIRASPPDLSPGESATLTALVVDPRAPSRANTFLWLACDPDPRALEQPSCAKYETLQDPAALLRAGKLPTGVRLLGAGNGIRFSAPDKLFEHVAADDLNRRRGVFSLVLLLALGAPPPADLSAEELTSLFLKVQKKEVDAVIAVKRIRIAEDAAYNKNPTIKAVKIGEEVWPAGLRPAKVRPGEALPLVGLAEEGSVEHFTQIDAQGQSLEKDEKLIFSWFVTTGELATQRTPAEEAEDQTLVAPFLFSSVPASRRGTMYAVLRDGRGGADWMVRGLFICDPNLPAALLSSVSPGRGPPGTQVTLKGEGLSDALDVRAGSGFLTGAYDPAVGAFVGTIPLDAPAGPMSLAVRGASCRADPESVFEVVR
jgi:hypothetical protein